MRHFFLIFFILLFNLNATPIDFSKNSETILLESEIYIDHDNLHFDQIKKQNIFSSSSTEHINLGFTKNTRLWVKLNFYNPKSREIEKILEIRNPLLESIILYDGAKIEKKGMLYKDENHKNINRIFKLQLKAHEYKTYYLKIENSTTALRLGIFLKDEISFLEDEHHKQMVITIFFSVIVMLLAYNSLLFIYTKESAYLFYCFYLVALISQQATYLGVSQMFLPQWFIYYDNLNVVFKVNIMYITAAIFAKSFLQTEVYPKINRIYNLIILVAIIEIPLFGTHWLYYPEIAVLTGFIFVIFNIFASIYIYKQGYTQARFFVIAWSFLVVGFVIMIFDALGLITIMQKISNVIIFLTALEALILSLAFTDRYMILKIDKEKSDKDLVDTLRERQKVIEYEIQNRTEDLNAALDNKKVLLKELHHRTKNNLQLILSLVRMQSDHASADIKKYSKNLENRINAIARTDKMLYLKDDLQQINMDEYIDELANDLESLSEKNLIVKVQARQIYLTLKEASYIGLILNELMTNSIKYNKLSNIFIEIEMQKDKNRYRLSYKDNGECYKLATLNNGGIGLKLVKTLVEDQLEGVMYLTKKNGCNHMIEFEL